MARKRYSQSDQKKRLADKMENYRAKGVDVREIYPIHPGGIEGVVNHIDRNFSQVKDQAQEQQTKR